MHRDEQAFQRIRDSQALQQRILAWLLEDPIPTDSSRFSSNEATTFEENLEPHSGEGASPMRRVGDQLMADQELIDSDPLDSEELNFAFGSLAEAEGVSSSYSSHDPSMAFEEDLEPELRDQPLRPGEIPAVQDRFYTLLKRRLQNEIQNHPPLFPWESEILDYESESSDFAVGEQVPTRVWTAQLENLRLPVLLPERVLTQLLDRCQELVQSSLREGARLVRATEALFPDQSHLLNDSAQLVLRAAYRDGNYSQELQSVLRRLSSYEAATPDQQMVLTLLAAREIMGTLTLSVSPSQRRVERQWLTSAGLLSLLVEYQVQTEGLTCLRIESQLPCGGSLNLGGRESRATAARPNAGVLSVEVFDPQPNQTYFLEVGFEDLAQNPLIFAVYPLKDE